MKESIRSIFALSKLTVADQELERTSGDIVRLVGDLGEFWETDLEDIVPAMVYKLADE